MNTIFVVSRDYIKPLYDNAVHYDFNLQAYSDFQQAINGLKLVNSCDLIGVAILDDDIYDLKGFTAFIKHFKLLGDIPLLIMLNKRNKAFRQLPKLGVTAYVNTTQEFFTDLTINQEVFGYLLLKRFEPYILKAEAIADADYSITTLHYEPLFSHTVLKILDPPEFQNNALGDYESDSVYASIEDKNSILAELRLLYLRRWLGESTIELKNKIRTAIDKIDDTDNFCLYSALLYEIGEC